MDTRAPHNGNFLRRGVQRTTYLLVSPDHGCRLPKRDHMERKCWSSREAQSRAAGEEGTRDTRAAPQITSHPPLPQGDYLNQDNQKGRLTTGKCMTPSVQISTERLSRHSEGKK